MCFWSVSWLTNRSVNFSFFCQRKKNWPVSETGQFFVHCLDFFLSSLDIREWPIFKKDWTKRSSGLWDQTIFLWPTKKNEKLTGQLVAKVTDQNHMDGTIDNCFLLKLFIGEIFGWKIVGEFSQLVTTAWDKSHDSTAKWSRLEHM